MGRSSFGVGDGSLDVFSNGEIIGVVDSDSKQEIDNNEDD